jgi:hypothetical protein
MNIHSLNYPHTTTLHDKNAPRKPTTLFEHFRADPRGAATFKQWREDRIWELLQRPATLESKCTGRWIWIGDGISVVDAIIQIDAGAGFLGPLRPRPDDGTVIKKWQGAPKA